MKVGDLLPVQVAGLVVAQASVKDIKDGVATIVIPGTIVNATVKYVLDDTPAVPDTETQIITDAPVKDDSNGENMEAEGAPVVEEKPAAEEQTAPIVAGSEAPDATEETPSE